MIGARRLTQCLITVLLAGVMAGMVPGPGPVEARGNAALQTVRSDEPVWPSDRAIRRAIQNAFSRDPRLQSPLHVRVYDGEVTLTGHVESAEAKRAAEEHAVNTIGVVRVRNLVRVLAGERRPGADDAAIADRVKAALSQNTFVEPSRIHVSVTDGMVMLIGTVDSNFERLRAEYAAFPIDGVRAVINRLEVPPKSTRQWDDEVQLDLDRELERSGY
jgi:osmotically-inducible protein OsmY